MTKITVISRTSILALTLSSLLLAAGCAAEPATNTTPAAASPTPAAAAPTVAPVEKAPTTGASPATNASPAASPAAPTKSKTP